MQVGPGPRGRDGERWATFVKLTSVKRHLTLVPVRIRRFSHKSLERFYKEGIVRGLPPDSVAKLSAWPLWKVHTLAGGREGTWSLHVTRNWRLTFRVDAGELLDVNLEDYH